MKIIKLLLIVFLFLGVGNYSAVAQGKSEQGKEKIAKKKKKKKGKDKVLKSKEALTKGDSEIKNTELKIAVAKERLAIAKARKGGNAFTPEELAKKEAEIAKVEKKLISLKGSASTEKIKVNSGKEKLKEVFN